MKRKSEIWKKTELKINNGLSKSILVSVLGEGLEPSRTEVHRILSPVRLPIPPSEQDYKNKYYFDFRKIYFKNFYKINLKTNFIN